MQNRVGAWKRALFAIGLSLVATVALGEQLVLECSLDTVNADGDSLGHDKFTLHIDTDRGTVNGDPAKIDKDYIRYYDPYIKDAFTSIDRHNGQLKGVNGNGMHSTGSCMKVTGPR